jgi:hypothetical protein
MKIAQILIILALTSCACDHTHRTRTLTTVSDKQMEISVLKEEMGLMLHNFDNLRVLIKKKGYAYSDAAETADLNYVIVVLRHARNCLGAQQDNLRKRYQLVHAEEVGE